MIWIINNISKTALFVKHVKVVKDGAKYYLVGDRYDRITEDMDEAAVNDIFRGIVSAIRAKAHYITINDKETENEY